MVRLTTDKYNRSTYSFNKGDSVPFRFLIKRGGSAATITDKKTYITIKKYSDSATYIVELEECTNSVTTGYCSYNLLPTDTSTMLSGHYYFEVKHVYTTNTEETIYEGDILVN